MCVDSVFRSSRKELLCLQNRLHSHRGRAKIQTQDDSAKAMPFPSTTKVVMGRLYRPGTHRSSVQEPGAYRVQKATAQLTQCFTAVLYPFSFLAHRLGSCSSTSVAGIPVSPEESKKLRSIKSLMQTQTLT